MKDETDIVKTMRELERQNKLQQNNTDRTSEPICIEEKCSNMTKISLNRSLSKDTVSKALKIILKDDILEGKFIKKFEDSVKDFYNVKNAISTSSARVALYLILKSLNLEKGREIMIPAYMLPILPQISEFFGLKPVFVDIDPETFNMNPRDIEKKITDKTKIILAVHLFGLPCDIEKISELAKKHNIILIEDCAQALGATYKGQQVGTFGHISYFSFNECKLLNTFGGGMILTNDDDLTSRIRTEINSLRYPNKSKIRKKIIADTIFWYLFSPFLFSYLTYPCLRMIYPFRKEYVKNFWISYQIKKLRAITEEEFLEKYGFKYTNMQAYIGLHELKKIGKNNQNMVKKADFLNKHLNGSAPVSTNGRVYYRYPIRGKKNEEAWYKLFKSGILTCIGSYVVLPDLDMFKDYFSECPNSREISKELVYLPLRTCLKKRHMISMLKILENSGFLDKKTKNLTTKEVLCKTQDSNKKKQFFSKYSKKEIQE